MKDTLLIVATLVAGVVGAGATAIFTTLRKRRDAAAAEAQRQAEVNAFLEGVAPVPGVTDGVLSAALRVKKVEDGLNKVADGQALLERRMDEANGTGRRTEKMVSQIMAHLSLEPTG